jgi:rod shape-determining protein MreD
MNNTILQLQIIVVSLLLAFVLNLAELPFELRWLRPNFVALILIFWLLHKPEWVSVGVAFCLGLLLDGVCGFYLGQHALSFALMAYVVQVFYQRLRMFSLIQQALMVLLLLALDRLIANWVHVAVQGGGLDFSLLVNAVEGAIIWPFIALFMERYRRLFSSY